MGSLDYPTEVDRDETQDDGERDLPDTIHFDRIVEWEWGTAHGQLDIGDGYIWEVRLDHAKPYAIRKTEPNADAGTANVVWER